jgi:succinoglycan biosynthesis protein ExoA
MIPSDMGTPSPLVSIILPCLNERDHITNCLESILRQESPPGGFEVIVADGMSDDGTHEILQQLAKNERCLRVVDNPERIVSTGLNAALRVAKGEIIMRMDAHTQYASDYVRQCVEVLHQTNADNVGGPWVAEGKGLVGSAVAAAFQSPFAVGGASGHNLDYEGIVDTVYLGCWPRHVFDRIGLFDEELVRNQDDEFNLRLSRLGGKIWQSPRIKSRYSTRSSLLDLFRQYMQYGYWKVRVIQKHGLPASVRHLVPAGFVLSLIVLTPAYLWWPLAAKTWRLLVGTYLLCVVIASFLTASVNGWRLFATLPLVFACYHFGYGYGFVRGVLDFIILRRGPHQTYTKLSRPTADHLPEQKL